MTKIRCASTDVKQVYEDLRQHTAPDQAIRQRVDTCDAVSNQILDYAVHWLEEKDKGEDSHTQKAYWAEAGSVFLSAASQKSNSSSQGSRSASSSSMRSRHSSISSAKKQEAAAELAATQATITFLQEMEREERELECLEAENRQRLALQEAENAAKKSALEEKRRQIKRL